MHELLDEPIRVIADFNGASVRPVVFVLAGRKYTLRKVNLVSESGVGLTKRWYFSVSDAANSFTLEYNPFDLSWRVREVYN